MQPDLAAAVTEKKEELLAGLDETILEARIRGGDRARVCGIDELLPSDKITGASLILGVESSAETIKELQPRLVESLNDSPLGKAVLEEISRRGYTFDFTYWLEQKSDRLYATITPTGVTIIIPPVEEVQQEISAAAAERAKEILSDLDETILQAQIKGEDRAIVCKLEDVLSPSAMTDLEATLGIDGLAPVAKAMSAQVFESLKKSPVGKAVVDILSALGRTCDFKLEMEGLRSPGLGFLPGTKVRPTELTIVIPPADLS